MSLPVSAVVAYAVTLVIAFASAVAHPWFEAEAHFVKALTVLNESAASFVVSEPP